jgi:hypothetical protein
MSNSNIYTAGLNNVGSYQVSGIPYVTSSFDCTNGAQIDFPFVTRWVVVSYSASSDTAPDLNIGFSAFGAAGLSGNFNYAVKPNTTTPRFELKLTQLFLGDGEDKGVSVMAGLTNLPVARVNNASPSGSNWSGSVGVG